MAYEEQPPAGTPESASIPRTYIHFTFGPIAQWMEAFANRSRELGWNGYTLTAGHCAQLAHPNELADILLKVGDK